MRSTRSMPWPNAALPGSRCPISVATLVSVSLYHARPYNTIPYYHTTPQWVQLITITIPIRTIQNGIKSHQYPRTVQPSFCKGWLQGDGRFADLTGQQLENVKVGTAQMCLIKAWWRNTGLWDVPLDLFTCLYPFSCRVANQASWRNLLPSLAGEAGGPLDLLGASNRDLTLVTAGHLELGICCRCSGCWLNVSDSPLSGDAASLREARIQIQKQMDIKMTL